MKSLEYSLPRPLGGIALLALGLWITGGEPLSASPFTPRSWQGRLQVEGDTQVTGKLVTWSRDRNHNFIDDLLDGRDPADRVDIIVDFNRCVTCDHNGEEEEVLRFLRDLGRIDHISDIVTFAVVLDVPIDALEKIAERAEVAMVEYLEPAQGMLTASAHAVRARASGTFSPNTAEDAFPAITGNGVTIAVIDSGVDNAGGPGTTHNAFPAGTFVGGANCLNNPCTIGDPDDDHSHGTHVAGIALGRQLTCTGGTCRGMAPGAGLVDIKVLNSSNFCVGASCIRGLELAIANRNLWGIDVANVSIGDCSASDGQNATAQLINTAVSLGMTVVVAAGNTGNCGLPANSALINNWASASLAITVGAANDGGTVPLGNDAMATFSLRGPRLSDGDGDPRDEQKPEISAPGQSILSAQRDTTNQFFSQGGTSMAAPHVAGAAALILQATPDITPGSLKEVLIASAAQSNKPGAHPGYDIAWGFGFLDVFAGLSRAIDTDVGRPNEPPYAPCSAGWCSPHIQTASAPKLNVANTITANVRNFTGTTATNARVCFGVYVFSNNFNRFFELGCNQTNLPGNATTPVSLAWTPSNALVPPGFSSTANIHACLKVSVDYPFDTDYGNNEMQRNLSVAQASIARVPFRLENNLTEPTTIELLVEQQEAEKGQWDVRVTENGKPVDRTAWTLAPEDCPKDLVIELEPPPGARRGDTTQVVVRALADGEIDFGGVVVDGVVEHETKPRWPWWWWLLVLVIVVALVVVTRRRGRARAG
jgi:serine protease AprX